MKTKNSFATLSEEDLVEVNGGSMAVIIGGIVIVGGGALGLGMYNGYKDTQSANKKKKK